MKSVPFTRSNSISITDILFVNTTHLRRINSFGCLSLQIWEHVQEYFYVRINNEKEIISRNKNSMSTVNYKNRT